MLKYMLTTVLCWSMLGVNAQAQEDYVALSKSFLQAIKDKKDASAYVKKFAAIDAQKFIKSVDTDKEKLAFWMNYYNGMIQYLLSKNPDLYKDRGDFFTEKRFTFAGTKVSFDMLEHGVLRRGVSKYSKGYFENPFGSDWHEPFEVNEIDWRIHFALNCGAKDCPPIRIYDAESVYVQLNSSARQYMEAKVQYKKAEDEVYVPALMNWFSGDFGGSDGVLDILHEYKQVPKDKSPDLEYLDYDWTLALGTFYKEN